MQGCASTESDQRATIPDPRIALIRKACVFMIKLDRARLARAPRTLLARSRVAGTWGLLWSDSDAGDWSSHGGGTRSPVWWCASEAGLSAHWRSPELARHVSQGCSQRAMAGRAVTVASLFLRGPTATSGCRRLHRDRASECAHESARGSSESGLLRLPAAQWHARQVRVGPGTGSLRFSFGFASRPGFRAMRGAGAPESHPPPSPP